MEQGKITGLVNRINSVLTEADNKKAAGSGRLEAAKKAAEMSRSTGERHIVKKEKDKDGKIMYKVVKLEKKV